jgi:hypothetical protein
MPARESIRSNVCAERRLCRSSPLASIAG